MQKYLIFAILALALFLRLYHLPQNFVFAGDEEHQALLALSLVKHFHIIWIGVNAAHLGFYLGPYWAYFTAFWLWLSQGDPLITGYVSSIIGVITTLLIILTGSALFNKRVGLLAGLLYATLPLLVFFDQKYWNPTLIPFLSLLLLLSLSKLKKNPKWLIVFAASAGLIFHTHLSLVPLIFIGGWWIKSRKIKLPGKIIFASLVIFLLIIAPLIAFDYFHKGSNITTPLRFKQITSDPVNKINPSHHFVALFQTLGRIWYIQPISNNSDELITSCAGSSRVNDPNPSSFSRRFNPPIWLSLAGCLVLLLFLTNQKTWQKDAGILLSLFIVAIFISFLLFPGGAYEYYLLGTFPLLLFLPPILADYFPFAKRIIIFLIFLISLLGFFTVITNNPEFGYAVKKSLIKDTADLIDDQPFELKQTGICHFYEGWRYLFVLNGKKPERSDSDQGLGWLYSEEITQNKTRYTVILSENRMPVGFDSKNTEIISSGGFTVYIFKNY